MILADTSVVIELQRRPSPRVKAIAEQHGAAVIGVTRAEVLTGARSPQERGTVLALLGMFRWVALDESIWDRTGDICSQLRLRGRPLPLDDALIAAAAIHYSVPLWTRDGHFRRIQVVAPELVIFDESLAA